MGKMKLLPFVLISCLLSAGCASSGGQVSVTCPRVTPLTEAERASPNVRQRLLNELLESEAKPTPE